MEKVKEVRRVREWKWTEHEARTTDERWAKKVTDVPGRLLKKKRQTKTTLEG